MRMSLGRVLSQGCSRVGGGQGTPLLDYYGSSLGIAGRSNNLAHKLMLEGGLVVREI